MRSCWTFEVAKILIFTSLTGRNTAAVIATMVRVQKKTIENETLRVGRHFDFLSSSNGAQCNSSNSNHGHSKKITVRIAKYYVLVALSIWQTLFWQKPCFGKVVPDQEKVKQCNFFR